MHLLRAAAIAALACLEALTGQPRSRALADAVSRGRLAADAAVEASGHES